MSNELVVKMFESSEFGRVRTVLVDGKPMLVASDVAKALGYTNPRKAIIDHCRCVTKCDIPHPQCSEQTVEANIIGEGDMYRLIVNSKLPNAEKFESWVFDDVLPTIRKTGSYNAKPVFDEEAYKQQVMRKLGIAPRKDVCNTLDTVRHISEKPKAVRGYCYGNFTNAVYMALFDMKAKEIKELLHVGKKHSLRDKLTSFELETLVQAEDKADELLSGNGGDRMTDVQLQRILEVLFPKLDLRKSHSLPEAV